MQTRSPGKMDTVVLAARVRRRPERQRLIRPGRPGLPPAAPDGASSCRSAKKVRVIGARASSSFTRPSPPRFRPAPPDRRRTVRVMTSKKPVLIERQGLPPRLEGRIQTVQFQRYNGSKLYYYTKEKFIKPELWRN